MAESAGEFIQYEPLPKVDITSDQYGDAYDEMRRLVKVPVEDVDLAFVQASGTNLRTILLSRGALDATTHEGHYDADTGENIPTKKYSERIIRNDLPPHDTGSTEARLISDPHYGTVGTIGITKFRGRSLIDYVVVIPTDDKTKEWPGDIACARDYRGGALVVSTMGDKSDRVYAQVLKDALSDIVPLMPKPVSYEELPPDPSFE